MNPESFVRLANNFYISQGIAADYNRIATDSQLLNYIITRTPDTEKKFKVALCCICINQSYWEFAKPMIDTAKQYFLPGHDVDYFLWSDMEAVDYATVFPCEPIEWPMPTLMRYHLMLQQEEKLKEYDYVFYVDCDMLFVNVVGDEILGERLTGVQQPMYALRREYWPPYEPNFKSAAYIKRPGKIINENGRPRFMPLYFAGGFQGGRTEAWIAAMKVMKKNIDDDFAKNYVAQWNDESHFNKYMFEHPDDRDVILTPSYTYPDSLLKEYFIPLWGQDYQPKLVTLTKKFTLSSVGGEHVQKMIEQLKPLQK